MAGYQKLDAVIETAPEERSVSAGFNQIAVEAHEIRKKSFSFREYYKNQLINDSAYSFGDQFLNGDADDRAMLVKKQPEICVELFVSMISTVRMETTVRFIITLLSDLTEDSAVTQLLVKDNQGDKLIQPLLQILFRNDIYSKFQACLIISRLASCSRNPMKPDDLNQFLSWSISNLGSQMEYLECVSRALMTFLKKDCYRLPFFIANGIKPILDILDKRITFQLQYQLIFCLWNLSFDATVVDKMKEFPVAIVLSDVLRSTNREKVQRVIFATFRNLLEKPSAAVSEQYATQMIHFKAVPVLNVLVKQTRDDSDLQDDIEFLHEKLNNSLQDLSSFDGYAAEVQSGRLEWSPVHRSDKFWRENVMRLNENKHSILRMLVGVLKESQNPVAIAVAAHDLGEYVRYYPRGKKAVEHFGGKSLVMNLVNHGNSDVRIQALLAIQKMMVQNWEYLGKQLEGAT